MCPCQREGSLGVIEGYVRPAIRRMAESAVLAIAALMDIVFLVASITRG